MSTWLSNLIVDYISLASETLNKTHPFHIMHTSAFKEYSYFFFIGVLVVWGHSERSKQGWWGIKRQQWKSLPPIGPKGQEEEVCYQSSLRDGIVKECFSDGKEECNC